MNLKKWIIIILIIVISLGFMFIKKCQNQKEDIKIPILLYHDFVIKVPEKDANNFNYINTPESFEENIKVMLENGYHIHERT